MIEKKFKLYGTKIEVCVDIKPPNKSGEMQFSFSINKNCFVTTNSQEILYLSEKVVLSSVSVRKYTDTKYEVTSFSNLWFENESFIITDFGLHHHLCCDSNFTNVVFEKLVHNLCFKFIIVSFLYVVNYCYHVLKFKDFSIDEVAFDHNNKTRKLFEKYMLLDYIFFLNIHLEGTFYFNKKNFDKMVSNEDITDSALLLTKVNRIYYI